MVDCGHNCNTDIVPQHLQQAAQHLKHMLMTISKMLTHAATFAMHCRRAVCLPADASGSPQVVPIHLDEIDALSSVRIYIPKDLRSADARALGLKVLPEIVSSSFPVFCLFCATFDGPLLLLLLQADAFVKQLMFSALHLSLC